MYEKKDVKNIFEDANRLNAKILTTEKDFIKLSDHDAEKINFLKIELKITDEERLINFLNDKLC